MSADLRVIKTKRLIAQAFMGLLQDQPVAQITIQQICQKALIGRSTFYNHYVDKYALLAELVQQTAKQFDQSLTRRMTAPQMDQLLIELYTDLGTQRQLILILLPIHEPQADLEAEFRRILLTHIQAYLKKLPKLVDSLTVPPSFLAELYAANAYTAILWCLKNGVNTTIPTMMNHWMQLVRESALKN